MNPFPATAVTALKGLVLGDAFGAPFEYDKNAPEHARKSLVEERYLDAVEDVGQWPARGRVPGLYTDDGQQALALLHAWNLATDPLDAVEVSRLFVQICRDMAQAPARDARGWLGSFGLHRGTGSNFRDAIQTGKAPDTAGLGGAMRIGPVATLLPDMATLVPWVVQVTGATTTHPTGLAGAVLFALAAWRAAHYPWGLPSRDERQARWEEIRGDKSQRPECVPAAQWNLFLRGSKIMNSGGEEALVKLGLDSGLSHKPFTVAANGFALTGVPWAIHHGLRAPSFPAALYNVCSSGGDTDTVGAMAGCLAALRLGADSIPGWMLAGIQGREHIEDPHLWNPVVDERVLTEMEEDYRIEQVKQYSPPACIPVPKGDKKRKRRR